MWKYVKKIRIYVFLQIILDLVCTICIGILPILQKNIVDNFASSNVGYLLKMMIIYSVLIFANVIFEYIGLLYTWKGAVKFEQTLKNEFFYALFRLNKKDFYSRNIGEYISMQSNNITSLEQDWLQPTIDLIRSMNMFIVYTLILFKFVDKRIAVVILIMSLIASLTPKIFSRYLSGKRIIYLEEVAKYTSKITDLLNGFNFINNVTFNNFNRKQSESLEEVAKKRYSFGKAKSINLSTNQLFMKFIQLSTFGLSVYLLYKKEITIGMMVASFSYIESFINPLDSILADYSAINSVKEIKKSFLEYTTKKYKEKNANENLIVGDLIVNDLEYANDSIHFKDINLKLLKGKKYAIIGPNGSGKSTFLKLIMNYYDLISGNICLCDKDIKSLDVSQYIGYISQHDHIFNEKYSDNVTLFESYQDIESEINNLDILKSIQNSNDCSKLSGGEKQIINLKRLLNQNKSIILLDEPFSAMNPVIKKDLEQFMINSEEMKLKTVVMVVHEPYDIIKNKFDFIIEIKENTINFI